MRSDAYPYPEPLPLTPTLIRQVLVVMLGEDWPDVWRATVNVVGRNRSMAKKDARVVGGSAAAARPTPGLGF